MEDIEAGAEDVDGSPTFVQIGSVHQGRLRASAQRNTEAGNGREIIARILKSSGKQLQSTLLTALASRIETGPFAKVKQLLQELIERLQKEAANEANQKGWCDKSTADAKQK